MYFDPGMGSLIIQTVIAGLAVVGGYFAFAKTKFKNTFRKKGSEPDEQPEMKAENEDDEL